MKIESYSFGRIIINGTTYTSDVIIYPNKVDAAWRRKEGHLLQLADVEDALLAKPEVLIIGTGYAGFMRVPRETIDKIAAQGIEVKVERTSKAADIYNALQSAKTVVAALHITC
jgi:hypothetical protein